MNQPSYNRVEPNPPLDFLIILGIIVMLILITPIVLVKIIWDLIARVFIAETERWADTCKNEIFKLLDKWGY